MQKEWILAAKQGDAEAFALAFHQYEIDLYKMAFIQMGNEADALDVVQEAAYRGYKYIHSLDNHIYFKTWLIRIVLNCAKDLLVNYSKTLPIQQEQLNEMEEPFEDLSEKWLLADLIDRLSPQEKDVILLKYYEDLTLQEIAKMLNMSLGTTKTILYRALKKLRKALQREESLLHEGLSKRVR